MRQTVAPAEALSKPTELDEVPNADLPGDYSIDHTSIFYLMDPNGEFVTHFSPTTPVEAMAAKLDKVL